MKIFSLKKPEIFLFFVVLIFLDCFNSKAGTNLILNEEIVKDSFDIKMESFLLPLRQPSGKYSSSLSLLNIFTPKDWTLDVVKAPMFQYAAKYSLPHGFNVQASLSTLLISNRITLGPYWNYSVNNCHFGIGYQAVFNYGVLKPFGYHSKLTGWEHQPTILVGYSFQTMALTFRSDLYWTDVLYLRGGDNVITFGDSFMNGYSFSLNLEQRITKNRVMSFGLKWSHLRYHIVAWPAFPVNSYRYDVPEIQLGLNF
ncbi:MAG: hypothetical protein ABI840_10115 [bacterium]